MVVKESIPHGTSNVKRHDRKWNVPAWAPFAVSIVAVVFSGFAVVFSYRSANYSYIQSEILRQNNLPNINITENLIDIVSDSGMSSSITIKNIGGPLSNLKAEAISCLVIVSLVKPERIVEVPIAGYYLAPSVTRRSKGVIARLTGSPGNISKYLDLKLGFNSSKTNFEVYYLETHLRIAYIDALDDRHVDYWRVAGALDLEPLAEKEWERLVESSKKTSINIDKLDLAELGRVLENIMSKGDFQARPQ